MWESVLAKLPGIFGLFATARFYSSKKESKMCWLQIRYRCSRCPDFHQKIPEFYEEWLREASDGDSAHIFWRGRCIYEGEDVFMKGKRKIIHEGEDVFMKGKMKIIHEGEDEDYS